MFTTHDGTLYRKEDRDADGNFIWCGRYAIVEGTNYITVYCHLQLYSKCAVDGAEVKTGELIGYMGSTGDSSGPHLHYTIKN
ncbi:MAG: peptidoglycan DD-metalloendopeptidase family protein, partial [Candidatus Aminicenantes bacterium]|nr:peptidoglycan DD-metalloendopeptidase family protein [Candidatus Aminicenantes bacterium]NIN24047.1 peptidoglycan DD-metalloendopeptidase family protein [Candidatus Aminicenantes bacterium]NIN47753.1 peptidoglycan DD-metalloendopeptidase family protein [Candidatus Aminicenantes bacterium]NIN90691.1 peptidoglycan DD-metalloendopeptidase family protein [Candidatus Aminicenantes bacterium]NIO87359.1 peptidoglycan DD-metalloendopeptidase family protein [Candidatus Aminicenantes bacterium]